MTWYKLRSGPNPESVDRSVGNKGGAGRSAGKGAVPPFFPMKVPLPAPLPALLPAPLFCQHPCQHSCQHFSGICPARILYQLIRIATQLLRVLSATLIFSKDSRILDTKSRLESATLGWDQLKIAKIRLKSTESQLKSTKWGLFISGGGKERLTIAKSAAIWDCMWRWTPSCDPTLLRLGLTVALLSGRCCTQFFDLRMHGKSEVIVQKYPQCCWGFYDQLWALSTTKKRRL